MSEPALYRFLTFHVPNLVTILLSLGGAAQWITVSDERRMQVFSTFIDAEQKYICKMVEMY
jgi:hypothetical protein